MYKSTRFIITIVLALIGWLGVMTVATTAHAATWSTVEIYDKSIYDSQGNFKDWHAYDEFDMSLKLQAPSNYNYNGYRRQDKATFSSRYKYKAANSTGKLYRISGPTRITKEPYIANTKLTATHNLKNYKRSTWTRTKYTLIKHQGKWMGYYFVKTKKHHASGWVKLVDMRLISPKQKRTTRAHFLKDPDQSYEIDQVYWILTTRERNEYANSSYMCDVGVDGSVPRDVAFSDFYLSRK